MQTATSDVERVRHEWINCQQCAEQTAHMGAGFGNLHERLKAGKAGADVLAGMIDGTLPIPLSCVKDRHFLVSSTFGRATMQGIAGLDCLNPAGTVEGGWTFKLADLTMGSAVLSVLPANYGYRTVHVSRCDFTKTLRDGLPVRAYAELTDVGQLNEQWFKTKRRPVLFASAIIRGPGSEVYAFVEASFRVFRTSVEESD